MKFQKKIILISIIIIIIFKVLQIFLEKTFSAKLRLERPWKRCKRVVFLKKWKWFFEANQGCKSSTELPYVWEEPSTTLL